MRLAIPSVALILAVSATILWAQEAPLISGGVGFISTTNGGATFFQPVIAPVGVLPLGSHFLIESRADLRGVIARTDGTTGPYEGEFFASLEYLQLDYLASSRLTLSAGRYLTPFNIYNERYTPIWIRNLQEAPLIFPIGTRTTGSSNGVMARGVAVSHPGWQLNYAAYFSASSNAEQFTAGRSAGFRSGVFFPQARLEIGGSYQRFLQNMHYNASGAYLQWQPWPAPLKIRGEYAHSPSGHGYWLEAAYRLAKSGGEETWLGRLQPVFRMQQFFRHSANPGDLLPAVNTQQADFGLNYYLPHEIRLNASYSRQFSMLGDRNIWNVAITHRFLLPLAGGGH